MFCETKKNIKIFFSVLAVFLFIFLGRVYFITSTIPNKFYIANGEEDLFNIDNIPASLTTLSSPDMVKIKNKQIYLKPKREGEYKGTLKLFGIVPVKNVMFRVMPNIKVIPSGKAIGIKLYSKGLVIIDTDKVKTIDDENINIAKDNDLEIGDIILQVNSKFINSTTDFIKTLKKCSGKILKIKIKRGDKFITKSVRPVKDKKGKYKIGIWVRDNTSGIGTLTFYDPLSGKYAALGHPILDVDTAIKYDVNKGEILKAEILSVKKGTAGNPGELEGIFEDEKEPIGNIINNNECGIYGEIKKDFMTFLNNDYYNKPIQVAYSNNVKLGDVKIISTIDENQPEVFDAKIVKINKDFSDSTKNMVIEITDKRLLNLAGGIVQGMSGSPIIQSDKIIGAVTHVFVNESSKGYGIFSEYMMDKMQEIK